MKCEVCGARVIGPNEVGIYFERDEVQPAQVCVVCGKVLCRDCSGGRLSSDIRVVPDYLCPTHYSQVRDFIEGLKPKIEVHHCAYQYEGGFYDICNRTGDGMPYNSISEDEADALYDYMRRERGD